MRRALPATVLTGAVLGAAGCGAQPQPTPDTATPLPPGGTVRVRLPDAGVSFAAPRAWQRPAAEPPQIAQFASGTAAVTLWRYPRAEPLPRTAKGLRQARSDLEAAVKARNGGFSTTSARILRIDGRPAVELRGTANVAGRPRTIRSLHVYAFGAEVVVDALAEPSQARRTDREVVAPLVRSLRLRAPQGSR
jgi:hypothetical protein